MPFTIHEEAAPSGYERLIFAEDTDSGLRAFICVNSTVCGPAVGGCRMWNYDSVEQARGDVLRLAAGMTKKNAMADLGLGGGKSVIIGDSRTDKSEALFRAFGRAVDSLGGLYYTAEDVGITPQDIAIVAQETPYAVGLDNGDHASGDPSPFTAEGVFQCMKVGAQDVFGSEELTGRRILVQGLGHVGMSLASKLHAAGGRLIVSDLDEAALASAQSEFDAEICPPEAVFSRQMDIFAPCALGGILNDDTVGKLNARLVCGAANNQLTTDAVAETLRTRDIRYLPDYVVNAGGIISAASEIHQAGENYRQERVKNIAARLRKILELSRTEGRSTIQIADEMVADILARAAQNKAGAA